jgi:hypothetical protein
VEREGFFRRRAFDGVRGAGEALFPKNTIGAPDFEDVAVVERTREYIAMLPREQRTLLYLLFVFVELVMPLLILRAGRFSRLDAETRREAVRRFRASNIYPVRMIGDSIKGVLTMMYMSHPKVIEHIGMYSVCDHADDKLQYLVRIDALRPSRLPETPGVEP